MNNNQNTLRDLIIISLFNSDLSILDSGDWSSLHQESIDQTVVVLTVPAVKKYAEDHDVPNLDQWTSMGDQLVVYFVCCFQAQRELVKLFEQEGMG